MTYLDDLLAGGWKLVFSRQCETYRHFIQVSEEFYEAEAERERGEIDALTADMTEEAAGEAWAMEGEYYQRVTEDFPQIARLGTFVTIHSFWESEYRRIAEWLLRSTNKRRGIENTPLKFNDFNGRPIEKSRIIVTRYVGISDDESLWARLLPFARIRNAIVHGGAMLPPIERVDSKLVSALEASKTNGLDVDEDNNLVIDSRLNPAFLQYVEEYVIDVLGRCERYFQGIKPVE